MAIFYNYIKGCGESTTGNIEQNLDTNNTDLWTWIKWEDTKKEISGSTTYQQNLNTSSAPHIWISKLNNWDKKDNNNDVNAPTDLGKIIVSGNNKVQGSQEIYTPIILENYLYVKDKFGFSTDSFTFNIGKNDVALFSGGTTLVNFFLPINFKEVITTESTVTINDKITLSEEGNAEITGYLKVGSQDISSPTAGSIYANNACNALYFNATSDRRAKTNITPSKFNALSIVKQLPIYNFNYISNNAPSVGIIAQEAQEIDLDGFNLVDQGLNPDGMLRLRESKLVYVLWKAVQELSAEVEDLKAQLKTQ